MDIWMKVGTAAILAFMLWKLWPVTRHWMKNGPKGSKKDWQTAIIALGAVVGFVILLIMMVR